MSCLNNSNLTINITANNINIVSIPLIGLVTATNKIWDLIIDFTISQIGGLGVADMHVNGTFNYNRQSNNQFVATILLVMQTILIPRIGLLLKGHGNCWQILIRR
jgi:hypothetical protein